MKAMVRISLTIPEEMKAILEDLAKKEDRSFAYITRKMIAEGIYHTMYKEKECSDQETSKK